MKGLLLLVGLVVAAYLILRTQFSFRRYRAALNALLAKSTLQALDAPTQDAVRHQVDGILAEGGYSLPASTIEARDERAWYGLVALAMRELGIPPTASGETWNVVSNPFVALAKADHQILLARGHLRDKYGIQVDLE
jgi:hypothetical protein